MEFKNLINYPQIIIGVIFILSILDFFLPQLSSHFYRSSFSQFVEYESLGRKISDPDEEKKRKKSKWGYFLLKLFLILVLVILWAQSRTFESKAILALYLFAVGFAFFTFLIMDLRHLQNILFFWYISKNPQSLSGKIIFKSQTSLRQSAIQFSSFFLLLLAILIFSPSYFFLGGICGSLFLILRNLILAKRILSS